MSFQIKATLTNCHPSRREEAVNCPKPKEGSICTKGVCQEVGNKPIGKDSLLASFLFSPNSSDIQLYEIRLVFYMAKVVWLIKVSSRELP